MRFAEPIGKWCEVKEMPRDKKTQRWAVWALGGDIPLGEIKWFGRWRGYAFFPRASTVFEPTCLTDIAAFVKNETAKRRDGNKHRRAYEKSLQAAAYVAAHA